MKDTKPCARCKVVFPRAVFNSIKEGGRVRPYCRPCIKAIAAANYIKHREQRIRDSKLSREKPGGREAQRIRVRKWHFKTHYGMTLETREEMETAQGGRCAICKTHFSEILRKSVHVDHCHETGQVRGLLCHHCNQVLGQSRDKIDVLQSAIRYLEGFRVWDPCREGASFARDLLMGAARRHEREHTLAQMREKHAAGLDAFA